MRDDDIERLAIKYAEASGYYDWGEIRKDATSTPVVARFIQWLIFTPEGFTTLAKIWAASAEQALDRLDDKTKERTAKAMTMLEGIARNMGALV